MDTDTFPSQLRHTNDDLTLYQPLRNLQGEQGEQGLSKTLSFQKLPNPVFAEDAPEPSQEESPHFQKFLPLRPYSNIAGYSTVFLPGHSPSFLIKSAKSTPRVIGLQGSGVQAMSSFHTEGCERGFIYADSEGVARVTELPTDCSYGEIGAAVRKIPLGIDTGAISYHPPTECYVVGCNDRVPFELPKDDDYHKEWARESLTFKPTAEKGVLKLITPVNWTVIESVDMEPCEIVTCVETLNLEVSESTNERKQLVTIGTAISKGEDLPIRGRVYVYEIADVIPEPGRPETNKRLKLVAKEDIPRGAVTSITEVGTQGLMLIAQGQKCMVRGLKEDGTLLPVAFMDMNCYVTTVKELPGTGLCVMSDAFKGVWFTGYTEEPYKMILFGKSATKLEVLNTDFLPDGKELFIVASDADGNIHILQFDPEREFSISSSILPFTLRPNFLSSLSTRTMANVKFPFPLPYRSKITSRPPSPSSYYLCSRSPHPNQLPSPPQYRTSRPNSTSQRRRHRPRRILSPASSTPSSPSVSNGRPVCSHSPLRILLPPPLLPCHTARKFRPTSRGAQPQSLPRPVSLRFRVFTSRRRCGGGSQHRRRDPSHEVDGTRHWSEIRSRRPGRVRRARGGQGRASVRLGLGRARLFLRRNQRCATESNEHNG